MSANNNDGILEKGKDLFIAECLVEARTYAEIRQSLDIRVFEPISKGLSNDRKYYIETADDRRMLLRVTDIAEYDRKKAEYAMMERVYDLGVICPKPYFFGLCDGSKAVYSLSGWLDGEDVESALPRINEAEQYTVGLKAGAVLRKIHTLPAPDDAVPWDTRFQDKIQARIDLYNKHNLNCENGEKIIKYLHDRQDLLKNRPQAFWHGDFSAGNQMLMRSGEIGTIDFNYWHYDHGDPWWEFIGIPWGEEPNAHYFTGLINGYFDNDPPHDFFELLAYYFASDALSALCYTFLGLEPCKPEDGKRHMENVLRWFDNLQNPVPSWYLKDFYIQWTDGVPYKLKAPFDFSFLSKYGKVFKVYDDQDSGNICFGVADVENKYFVKFAGAPTERSRISTDEAVDRIKNTISIYQDLAHPLLTKLISAEEIGGGFAMVFEWTDAECMGRQYPGSREKFVQMPLDTRLRVFDEILAFHDYVAKQGYVAIDFYDGCIMYDFNIVRTVLCDIEFYAKMPYNNPIGRMWGSSRFMSPEEFELGAVIDEITNVYTMGATAFAFFGDEQDRRIEKWKLSKELFDVAKRAVSDGRDDRQQSIQQLIDEWRAAK